MQGKGIIKFFLVVMTIVCTLQYIFILPTRQVEKAADEYAKMAVQDMEDGPEKRAAEKSEKAAYLDSMSSEVIFKIPLLKDFTYQELKSRQLHLGLDLSGGMSVVLQVDLREFIRSLANDSKDPTFENALNLADQKLKSTQSDYVTLFADSYNEVSQGKEQMNKLFASNAALKDEITFETSNAEMVQILRSKADETVELTFKRLKDRIDQMGVVQPNVSLDAARDLIVVELPGISNPERARTFLQAAAKLEFWNIYRFTDNGIRDALVKADDRLKKMESGDTSLVAEAPEIKLDTTYEYQYDTLGNVIDSTEKIQPIAETLDPLANRGPLLKLLEPNAFTGTSITFPQSVMGTAKKNKIEAISNMLDRKEVKALFPKDLEFRWAQKPTKNYETGEMTDNYELYAIKRNKGRTSAPLEGDLVTDASSGPNPQTGKVEVTLRMSPKGAKVWGNMTTKAAQDNNREIAIVLDDRVVSAPSVNDPILNGNSSITGNYTIQEADDLAKILQVGKLPAKTKIIQEDLVGPYLGQENINRSINSLLIGFGMVFLFMIFYYGGSGIVSIIALFMNMFFIFGSLASYGTVLTLPGVAGIVLTIGMAVDANVIIFERVREELREGKSLLASITDGFKHSYSAIIDANVTTILTAFVLAYFGLGPIKGFAVVLIIGVLSSLFTAVLLGRMMIDWWTGKERNLTFWTNSSKNAFANLTIDWLGKRKIAYVISGTIILLGIGSFVMRGFELGVDFKGGYSYNIQFDQNNAPTIDALRAELTTAFEGEPVVKEISTENTYNVTTSYLINDNSDEATNKVMSTLFNSVNGLVGGNLNFDNFKDPDGTGTHVTSSSKVGPTIADDIKESAIYAAIFALLLIFLYIFIRFNKWEYSAGAVAALFHDTLVVLAIFSIFHGILPFSLEINQAFIAAILTVIGYSINDTVVVFDRIREYINNYTKGKSKEEIINMAINSTISRTIITSLTTLFTVAILLFFGGTSIRGFAFALFIGIIVGTYSSVFVATPIMSDLSGDLKPKETKKKSFSKAATAR
ncbi:MAG: protein translocase subunit SecDF [Bacteroidota bacterium]